MARTSTAAPTRKTPVPPDAPATYQLPAEWPGSFGLYKYSREAIKINLGTFIALWIIDIIAGFIWQPRDFHVVGHIISVVLSILLTVTFVTAYLATVRGKKISSVEAFNEGLPFVIRMIGLGILVALSLAVSILLLVVPFFFVLPRLVLAEYFLIDKNMGVIEAYKASWHATEGHSGKIWAIIGVNILMVIPVITIVGIIATIYLLFMYNAAMALLYVYLTKSQSTHNRFKK